MLRKGLILLAVSATVSVAVTQGQVPPRSSTDTIFYDPHNGTSEQQAEERLRRQEQLSRDPSWPVWNSPTRPQRPSKRKISSPIPLSPGSVASLSVPEKAIAAFASALRHLTIDPPDLVRARQYLDTAVEEYPEYAAAWTRLGQVKADLGDADGAIVALQKSVELDQRYLAPYDALVWLYMAKGDWDHATELTQFVLDIDPTYTKMRWYQAGCAYESGRDDEAIALFREIEGGVEAARFLQAHLFLGLIYARRGELAKAAADYKLYLQFVPNAPDAEWIQAQLDEWQKLGVI